MIKLVASDLDGTLLLNGAQSLPEELFPLIKELKELGILFVAASGRQYANMKRMFAPVVDDMAFIAENGGLAIQNEKVLYQDSFPKELVREIVEAIYDKKDADFTCSTKDFYYIRPKTEHYREILEHVAQQSSACERRAQEAERESDRLKKAEYMSYHLGEEFEGIISGVTAYGFYVELPNTVEGLVHVTSLRDDYYSYNEETYELSGELSHKVYHLGQKVRVRVADADALKRTVDFTVVE